MVNVNIIRYLFTFGFILALYFLILRKGLGPRFLGLGMFIRYERKLNPLTWYREGRTEGWKKVLKVFFLSMPVIILLYFLLPVLNTIAEALAGGVPSVVPGDNPVATMVRISPYFLLVASIFVPIIEEWIFRLILLEEFNVLWGPKAAVILSTALFAGYHLTNTGFNLHSVLVPFIAGLIYGVAYLKGGLKASVFCHSGNNTFRVITWMLGR